MVPDKIKKKWGLIFKNVHFNGKLYNVLLFSKKGQKNSINNGSNCIQIHYHSDNNKHLSDIRTLHLSVRLDFGTNASG